MNPVNIRLLNQQLASPQFRDPAAVVSHLGAVQAQEYRLMRWAVAMRTANPSARAFRAAYDAGRIVRLHLLRGTWQLVSGDDYWWMLGLCASKAERVIRGWMSANKISIPETELYRVREIIALTVEEKGSVTKEDFVQALAERDMVMDDHRLSYHIRMSELCGLLCSGDLLPMKASYSLSSRKLGSARPVDRDEALALLARKYFQSHSPATFEDYVWWSGMGVGDCRRGMSLLGGELLSFMWNGREFHMHESCRTRGFRSGNAVLLPPYDEYLIGYKSRDLSLPPEHMAKAHNNSGNFYPILLHDGMVCGNWAPFRNALECSYFIPGTAPLNEDVLWEDYIRFRSSM